MSGAAGARAEGVPALRGGTRGGEGVSCMGREGRGLGLWGSHVTCD